MKVEVGVLYHLFGSLSTASISPAFGEKKGIRPFYHTLCRLANQGRLALLWDFLAGQVDARFSLARKVMESEHVLLVGAGAEQFARAHGVEQCPPASLVVPRELERWNAIRDSTLANRIDGLGGIILLDCCGHVGYAFNTPRMAYAYMRPELEQPVFGI